MSRIFILLSIISLVLILCVGGGSYWLSLPDMKQAKQNAGSVAAQGLAKNISDRLFNIQHTLNGMAQLPSVMTALQARDLEAIETLQSELQVLLPYARRIRILHHSVSETDSSSVPHMGYADLEMVQSTLTSPQQPVIQGSKEHRHLALTSVVNDVNGQVLGVILASLKFDFLNNSLSPFGLKMGLIEIRQQKAVLATAGDPQLKLEDDQPIQIKNSLWQIYYWPNLHTTRSMLTLLFALVGLSGLLVCLSFFISYRKLAGFIRQDQSSILKAAKDLLSGKISGNYPVHLNEMKPVITNIVQYKRVVDQQGEEVIDDDSEIDDGFFDEGLESSFLDINRGVELDEDDEIELSMPDTVYEEPETTGNEKSEEIIPISPFTDTSDLDRIFKAYDVRGIVDKTITADIVYKIGKALGAEAEAANAGTVVIARDGRLSSQAFAQSLAEGVISSGRNVLDIGVVPTPVLYFVAHHSEGRSGAMITASHNPAEYNGVKIVVNGKALFGEGIKKLQKRIENDDYVRGSMSGSVEQNTLFTNEYIGMLCEDIHMERPMKVVIDCGNGAASELAPVLLRTIGCEVIELYCEIDGNFPNHHPDPSRPENLVDLVEAVKQNQADIGLAFDGDGDRLGVVDSSGKVIWPDRQMMMFAKNVLADKPGSEVIFDVKCSRHLTDVVIKHGGRPLMWKTGHSLVKAKVKETGAVLAGEMSGHIIFNDRWFDFDDALYAASRLIEILSADTRQSSEVFADFPDSHSTPEINVPIQDGTGARFVEQMFNQANFQDGNVLNIDGLRVEFDDGWGLVRASNTTPSLVLRFEADSEQAMKRIQHQFKQLMLQVNPELSLPF